VAKKLDMNIFTNILDNFFAFGCAIHFDFNRLSFRQMLKYVKASSFIKTSQLLSPNLVVN